MGRGVKGAAGAFRAGGKVRRGRQASVAGLAALLLCVEHDTHLVQKTVPQVFTAKCSEPQAVIREDMSERSG